jgi:hypothetical protein
MKLFVIDQVGAFALMLAVVVADHLTGGDTRRRAAYAVAVVVSAAITAPLEGMFEPWFHQVAFSWTEFPKATSYALFEWIVLGGAATFIYLDRRRAWTALALMHAAQIECANTAKRALESRLQAMQARVEPQFLFNTLA